MGILMVKSTRKIEWMMNSWIDMSKCSRTIFLRMPLLRCRCIPHAWSLEDDPSGHRRWGISGDVSVCWIKCAIKMGNSLFHVNYRPHDSRHKLSQCFYSTHPTTDGQILMRIDHRRFLYVSGAFSHGSLNKFVFFPHMDNYDFFIRKGHTFGIFQSWSQVLHYIMRMAMHVSKWESPAFSQRTMGKTWRRVPNPSSTNVLIGW